MRRYIIGVAGRRNSGKDTVASMINYIFAVGITKASYQEWVLKRVSYDNTNADRIVYFADKLKEVTSIIYNIPRDRLYDRDYKDNKYFGINNSLFYTDGEVRDNKKFRIITIAELNSFDLAYILSRISKNVIPVIKLRALLQYIGTNICRVMLDDTIWIKSAINNAIDKSETRKVCIIPDVRFENEAKTIQQYDGKNMSLYGGIIKVNRDEITDSHESETINFECDYTIENNSTLIVLFYKVLEICQKIQSI